jgi:hypothetical protein
MPGDRDDLMSLKAGWDEKTAKMVPAIVDEAMEVILKVCLYHECCSAVARMKVSTTESQLPIVSTHLS